MELYRRTLYTKKVKYLIHPIYEYDIEKANISILLQYGYITANEFTMYSRMSKIQRQIAIGKLQKDPRFARAINIGFEDARRQLIESNNLQEEDIVSIKRDAFYVLHPLSCTKFGYINFTIRNNFSMMMICRGIEIYFGYNDITGECILDFKGINDRYLNLHDSYISEIAYILTFIQLGNIDSAITELINFMKKYDNRTLDISYYREFNAESMFRIGRYGTFDIDEEYKNVLDISNNQFFNKELLSILTDIKFSR